MINSKSSSNKSTENHIELDNKVYSGVETKTGWYKYFKQLAEEFNDNRFDQLHYTYVRNINNWIKSTKDNPIIDGKITEEEADKVISKLKNFKAGGYDEILPEMIKYGGEGTNIALTKFFNIILETGIIPNEWKIGSIFTIFKGGNGKITNPNDYRGITLTSTLAKILESIILKRLSNYSNLCNLNHPNQAGFTKNRSTIDQASVLLFTLQARKTKKLPTFCLFIDLQKAYDRTPTMGILKCLYDNGITGKTFNLIRNWYKDNLNSVRTEYGQTYTFAQQIGLKQGSVLSPFIFNLYISNLANEIEKSNIGMYINDIYIGILLYADDLVLIADSIEELQKMANIIESWCNKNRLIINIKKTKTIYFNYNKSTSYNNIKI